MNAYEYKVIPAPSKGRKGPGVKGPEARFAHGLELLMNELGEDGWDYVRSDILPSEERQGLTSSQVIYRSVLVFRRQLKEETQDSVAFAPAPRPRAEPPLIAAAEDQTPADADMRPIPPVQTPKPD